VQEDETSLEVCGFLGAFGGTLDSGFASAFVAASNQRAQHNQSEEQCDNLFHFYIS
jgi:hypothetical protein